MRTQTQTQRQTHRQTQTHTHTQKLGQYERALEAYSKSLDIKIQVLDQHHPSLADTKYNMALLHKKRGERHLAKELYLECEAIYSTAYGPDHSETIDAKHKASDCA